MDSNQGYKNRALADLEGNWTDAAIVTLVLLLVLEVGGGSISFIMPPLIEKGTHFVWFLLCIPLGWGYTVMFLDFIRYSEKLTLSKMFSGYKEWSRTITTYLLMYIYIFLWTLLLIIPGIIKAYSYALTPYILKDNPELSNNAAIEESMQMMDGHKWKLFCLHLSFIGWLILSLLTLGIGLIFLQPYMRAAESHFYEDLKREKQIY